MGVVAFRITLIPLIGSVLYWIVATTLALFTSPVSALIFAIIYLIYIQLEAYVLTPRVMSRAISVPGALVVIGALVGGTLLGLLGALVAIPITASILLIIKQIVDPAAGREDLAESAKRALRLRAGRQAGRRRRRLGAVAHAPRHAGAQVERERRDLVRRWPATSRMSRTTTWWRGQSTPDSTSATGSSVSPAPRTRSVAMVLLPRTPA